LNEIYSKYESVFLVLTYTVEVHPEFLYLKEKDIFITGILSLVITFLLLPYFIKQLSKKNTL